MDGGVSAAAIELHVLNMIDVLKDEYFVLQGLDKDTQQLQSTLMMIQAILNEAMQKYISQEAFFIWLKELQAAAKFFDELNYVLHKNVNKAKTSYPIDKVLSFFTSFSRKRSMSHTIKQINAEFESVMKRANDLGLQRIIASAPAAAVVAPKSCETDSSTLVPLFTGRDDDVRKLVDMLTHLPEDPISIVALVGMGGIGKTTLTRKVFKDDRVQTRFGSRIWVHVSQTFDLIGLFKKILLELTNRTSHDDRYHIMNNLHEALKNKSYLLVLDDVWNEDIPMCEDFVNYMAVVSSTKGNGIIITTRSHEVASIANPIRHHVLNDLSDDDCWSIIKGRVFDRDEEVPLGIETIGRKIAKRCHGLPLAAKVVGDVLRGKLEEKWRFVSENWLSHDEAAYCIAEILNLSFDNLPLPSLKVCFAYCSVLPKGRDIAKQELIELWMAEGFLQPSELYDMESLGNMFVNVLVQNSLLQVAEKDDQGNVWSCVMHNLVHDLVCLFLSNNNSDDSTQIRYMFLKEESSPIPKEVAKHLHILECENSDIMFSDFKSLRILTLSGDHYKELPDSVRELINLRKLNISDTRIEHLPDWIDELLYLQTLRLCKSPLENPKLPRTVTNLLNLRHLYITQNTELPVDIGRLTDLRTLSHFRVGKGKGYQIEELRSLEHLKGKLEISNLEKVHDTKEALKANISEKSNLSELVLKWEASREGERNDEAVLESLQPHSNAKLNTLTISGFQGKKIPALGHLPNLKFLSLSILSNVTSIDSLFCGTGNSDGVIFPALESMSLLNMGELSEWTKIEFSNEVVFPRLQSLKMHHCDKLEWLPNWLFHNTDSLRELDIRHCPKLRKVPDGLRFSNEVKVFPGLQSLTLYHCNELECVPNMLFRNTHSLSELDIRHCPVLRELSYGLQGMTEQAYANDFKVFPGLKSLKMYHCYRLESLPNCLFRNTHSLSELDIRHCPMLKELLAIGQSTLDSLEQMNIRGCRNLKSIAYPSAGGSLISLPRLHSLEIRDCQELEKMVEPLAPLLEKACLEGLKSLENLPKFLDCLAESPLLEELSVVGVPELASPTSSVENWPFPSLIKLEIDVSRKWSEENNEAIKLRVDGMLKNCNSSLSELDLTGLEIWKCLPDSLQHLTDLYNLKLANFGVEALPECFGKLSSLTALSLSNCRNLKSLPSMQRLTKLEKLCLADCPKLRIESERHKFSSKTLVYINGHLI